MEVENEGLWEVRFGSWKVWDECRDSCYSCGY